MNHVLQNTINWNIEARKRSLESARVAREAGKHQSANNHMRDSRRFTRNINDLNERLAREV